MKPRVVTASLAFIGLFTSDAYAYLDPGTGSILLQALSRQLPVRSLSSSCIGTSFAACLA